MKALLPVVITVVLAGSAVPRLLAAELAAASAEDWHAALECLAEVDQLVRAGNTDAATLMLRNQCELLPAPLSDIARLYLEDLRQGGRLWSDSVGLARIAEQIGELNDSDLRRELEDRLLASKPPPRDASASILMARALRAFADGELDTALKRLVDTQRQFPGSTLAPLLLYNEAVVLRDLNRYEDAIEAFKQLLSMPVDNREPYVTSVMDAGYRNYHYRAAVNLSWCYEQIHDYSEAYRWIELTRTQYPYQGWCGVEIDGARLHAGRTADRLAWKAGGILAVRRFGTAMLRLWYAWAPWLLLSAAWLSPLRRKAVRTLPEFSIAIVGIGVGMAVAVLHPSFFGDATWWFSSFWLVRWVIPGSALLVAVILLQVAPRAARRAALAALVFAAIGHAFWLWWFVRYFHLDHLPFFEKQLAVFAIIAPAAAVIIATFLVFLSKGRRKPSSVGHLTTR